MDRSYGMDLFSIIYLKRLVGENIKTSLIIPLKQINIYKHLPME